MSKDNQTTTVLLCGVGGQGTILAAALLAQCCMQVGLEVKVSEIHGMSQRGGAVTTVVRIGEDVHSMVTDLGSADIVVSFEVTEALRNLPYLKEGGALIVNDEFIKPMPVLTRSATMPMDSRERLEAAHALMVPAAEIAREVGNAKTTNVVLLGALSACLDDLDLSDDAWRTTIEQRVPQKTIKVNLDAFTAGRDFILNKEEGQ